MIFLFLIMGIFLLVSDQDSRASDLQLVGQLQALATGLEKYYDKFYSYPPTSRLAVENIRVVTENGFNQEGNLVYYQKSATWPRSAVLSSEGQDYKIEFVLDHGWSAWQAKAGDTCFLKSGLIMECRTE